MLLIRYGLSCLAACVAITAPMSCTLSRALAIASCPVCVLRGAATAVSVLEQMRKRDIGGAGPVRVNEGWGRFRFGQNAA
jgi:hypothetical protein